MNAGSAIIESIHLGEPDYKMVSSLRLPLELARSLAGGESIQSVDDRQMKQQNSTFRDPALCGRFETQCRPDASMMPMVYPLMKLIYMPGVELREKTQHLLYYQM